MHIKESMSNLALVKYVQAIRNTPRSVVFNRALITSALIFASSAIPMTWDQGAGAVVPSLPGFQHHFHISSGKNPGQVRNFVSLVYIGYAIGSALSFFINDRVGRLWSYRGYLVFWMIGQMVAISAPDVSGLWAARIISGAGIGGLTVSGPMSLAEIAPTEIRGLLTSWFVVAMGIALFTANFCTLGIYLHVPASRLQYQIVFFAPCIFMALCVVGSFFVCESPRWLMIVDRPEEASRLLSKLRGLPLDHPRVQGELRDIQASVQLAGGSDKRPTLFDLARETFTKRSNLRRVQQTIMAYALAQLSGANSITSYFVPYMNIISPGGDTTRDIFLSGMYGFSKFWFSLIASFVFIDALGRRNSLFIGCFLQMVSDIYIGVYIKYQQEGSVSNTASQAAVGMLFVHAFGYSIGLLSLPYVFGGELWPNRIRSFGGAMSQTFHWLFIYAIKFSIPSLLKNTDNWGAFIFFAAWCFVAIIYVFLVVPETAGLSVEEIEEVFTGPWFSAYRRSKSTYQFSHQVEDAKINPSSEVEWRENTVPREDGKDNVVATTRSA